MKDAPIRVLHVLGSLDAGGMQSMIMNYYRHIDREKLIFDFLVFSDSNFFKNEVISLGGRVYRITSRRENFIKNRLEINEFYRSHKEYKIIHFHQGINYFSPLVLARRNNVSVRIAHSHGMDPQLIKKQGFLYTSFTQKIIRNNATHFFACSINAANQIFTNDIVSEENYYLMKNAIDLEIFKKEKKDSIDLRSEMRIGSRFVVGHIGNFLDVKNHDFLLDIFEKIHEFERSSVLLLVGSGINEVKIKEKVHRLNLDDSVFFLGTRSDIPEILRMTDCVVFPSFYEGLPVTIIEAQASGIRCFISDTITREVKVSELVDFISLATGADEWARMILGKRSLFVKPDYLAESITSAGYNIAIEVEKLTKKYLELLSDKLR